MNSLVRILTIGALWVVCLCPSPANGVEPWKGNTIGISDVPPPPFTAVTVDMNGGAPIIGCWGRTYTLADTGLPVQIHSKGMTIKVDDVDLLAAPVRLVTESGGIPVVWTSTGVNLVKNTQAQVILEGTALSSIGQLDWKCTAEYDGLLRYDLQITPLPGATVNKLELVFSVKPEHAPLMWLPGQYPVERHGPVIPQSGGANWYTWLGDLDRGLAVFFETDEAWDNPDRSDAWRLEQLPGSVDTAWRFIQGSKALPNPWKYTFGIMATPVKETPGGRKWAWYGTRPLQTGDFLVQEQFPASLKHFGYPEATDDTFRQSVAGWHQSGVMVCPYILLNVLSAGAPELIAHPEWKTAYPPIPFAPLEYGATSADPCVSAFGEDLWEILPTQDFTDWIVWKCDQFVRANDVDGLYHDFTMLMVLQDIPQGFGYMRGGTPVRCYPFFERRELYKRIFTMLKQYKRDDINIGHMSGDMYVPLLSFCDVILNGEHFKGTYWNGMTYPQLLTDNYLNTELMGHNYGLTSVLLEEWENRGDPPEKQWEKDTFLSGLTLLYDFGLVRATNAKTAAFEAFNAFGVMDGEFVPFWHLGDIVGGQTDEVRCSAYLRKTSGAMLAFFNRGETAQEMTFTVDWAGLKSDPGPVTARYASGAFAGYELSVLGDQLKNVQIPAGNFVLVEVTVPDHTITASNGPHGTIDPRGDVVVVQGDSQTFTITPQLGYYLAVCVVGGTGVDTENGLRSSYTFDSVTADSTISVSFAIYRNNISGRVTKGTTTEGLGGVTVALSSLDLPLTDPKTTTTSDTGIYYFNDITAGNYTLTPTLTGYGFAPVQIELEPFVANVPLSVVDIVADTPFEITVLPSGTPNPVVENSSVLCKVTAPGAVRYLWTVYSGHFEDSGGQTSDHQNPTWIADIAMADTALFEEVELAVTAYAEDGRSVSASYSQQVNKLPVPKISSSSGGCFIATAAFGTPMAKEVVALEQFRDRFLLHRDWGRAFVRFYYRHSPAAAEFIRPRPIYCSLVRGLLRPLVWLVKAVM